jgi:hypothetical protein
MSQEGHCTRSCLFTRPSSCSCFWQDSSALLACVLRLHVSHALSFHLPPAPVRPALLLPQHCFHRSLWPSYARIRIRHLLAFWVLGTFQLHLHSYRPSFTGPILRPASHSHSHSHSHPHPLASRPSRRQHNTKRKNNKPPGPSHGLDATRDPNHANIRVRASVHGHAARFLVLHHPVQPLFQHIPRDCFCLCLLLPWITTTMGGRRPADASLGMLPSAPTRIRTPSTDLTSTITATTLLFRPSSASALSRLSGTPPPPSNT